MDTEFVIISYQIWLCVFDDLFVQMSSSVWKLMSTQLNFAVSMATAILSVLLSSGTVVLNFIVSVVSKLSVLL